MDPACDMRHVKVTNKFLAAKEIYFNDIHVNKNTFQ